MGTWLDGNKIMWKYTDDFGRTFRRAASKAITDQVTDAAVTVGGVAGVLTDPPMDTARIRPRGVYCVASGKPKKLVVVYAPDAPLITAGTTINLNTGTTSTAYTSTGETLPERKIRGWSITETT
jgi:hypothetical protein